MKKHYETHHLRKIQIGKVQPPSTQYKKCMHESQQCLIRFVSWICRKVLKRFKSFQWWISLEIKVIKRLRIVFINYKLFFPYHFKFWVMLQIFRIATNNLVCIYLEMCLWTSFQRYQMLYNENRPYTHFIFAHSNIHYLYFQLIFTHCVPHMNSFKMQKNKQQQQNYRHYSIWLLHLINLFIVFDSLSNPLEIISCGKQYISQIDSMNFRFRFKKYHRSFDCKHLDDNDRFEANAFSNFSVGLQ